MFGDLYWPQNTSRGFVSISRASCCVLQTVATDSNHVTSASCSLRSAEHTSFLLRPSRDCDLLRKLPPRESAAMLSSGRSSRPVILTTDSTVAPFQLPAVCGETLLSSCRPSCVVGVNAACSVAACVRAAEERLLRLCSSIRKTGIEIWHYL